MGEIVAASAGWEDPCACRCGVPAHRANQRPERVVVESWAKYAGDVVERLGGLIVGVLPQSYPKVCMGSEYARCPPSHIMIHQYILCNLKFG